MALHFTKGPLAQYVKTATAKRSNRFISTNSSPLSGARCIITGASRGIGRAIAQALASQHASILLLGRDTSSLESTLSACQSLSPGSSYAIKTGDISERAFWTNLDISKDLPLPNPDSSSTQPVPEASRLDILVNAAGVTHKSLFIRTSASQIENVVQTNLMGTLWACQIMGKKMLRNKPSSSTSRKDKGVIVNIASLLATHGGTGSAAYAASKAGVLGLTRALAAELGPAGVRVNAVVPGYIETEMTQGKCLKFSLFVCISCAWTMYAYLRIAFLPSLSFAASVARCPPLCNAIDKKHESNIHSVYSHDAPSARRSACQDPEWSVWDGRGGR